MEPSGNPGVVAVWWFIGVDGAQRKTGLVALHDLDNEPFEEKIISTKRGRPLVEDLHQIRVEFHEFVRVLLRYRREPIAVLLEEKYVGSNRKTSLQLAMVQGVLCVAAYDHDATLFHVKPSLIKAFACGAVANAGKTDVGDGCYSHWGYQDESDDLVDAYAAAQMARCAILGKMGGYEPWQIDRCRPLTEAYVNG